MFEVANTLGAGFLEEVTSGPCYENSLSAACGLPYKFHFHDSLPLDFRRTVRPEARR